MADLNVDNLCQLVHKCFVGCQGIPGNIMKKRYKIILNVEITDPDKPFPAGGDYTHLSRIDGVVMRLTSDLSWLRPDEVKISLDKVIDKGEIKP